MTSDARLWRWRPDLADRCACRTWIRCRGRELRNVPTAIVTGSNGKTTTVRLLAACARAHGWRDGYNCTDGLFIAGEQIESGDYSGPVGTRTVLRDSRVEAAILETARGGILRRGLAAQRARVAVVTNVSADHFGEYGIDDLAGLADTKLVVASTIDDTGLLVLNADDRDPARARGPVQLSDRLVLAQLRRRDAALASHEGRLDERRARRTAHRQLDARQLGGGVRPGRDRGHAAHRRRHRRLQRAERRWRRTGRARPRHSACDRRDACSHGSAPIRPTIPGD